MSFFYRLYGLNLWYSSVTAGHDSPYNRTTAPFAGEYMRTAFAALDIEVESRGVALGNNPCVPYDICVNVFAGLDADIVHWEQTYFCWVSDDLTRI